MCLSLATWQPDTDEMHHSSRFAQMYLNFARISQNVSRLEQMNQLPSTPLPCPFEGTVCKGFCECLIDFSNLSRISHLWGHIFRTVKIGQEKDGSRRLLYRYHVSWPSFWIPYWYGSISLLNPGRNPVVCQKAESNIFQKTSLIIWLGLVRRNFRR